MSFTTALKTYFDAVEDGKSQDELFELKENVIGYFNEYTPTDELREAKDLLSQYKHYGDSADSLGNNKVLLNMGKSVIKGSFVGAGLSLFASTNQRLMVLGGLLGFEVAAIKFQYLKYSIKKIASEFDVQLDEVLKQVEPNPTSLFAV